MERRLLYGAELGRAPTREDRLLHLRSTAFLNLFISISAEVKSEHAHAQNFTRLLTPTHTTACCLCTWGRWHVVVVGKVIVDVG
jgi:hypothetical protein